MKRKWIFLFSLTLLMLSHHSKASYAYYEEPEEESEGYQSHVFNSQDENHHDNQNEIIENDLAQRLHEENQKLSELSQNIDVKLPLELELEQTMAETESETEQTDSTEVKQSAISRKPAIKKEDQIDLSEEETQSLFPEETDEVSLSNSAILKTPIENSSEYRTRKVRSR